MKLKDYDKDGNFIGKMPDSAFAHFFDEAAKNIEQKYPHFTVGFIFCIRKSLTEEKIMEKISRVCELNWERTIGIDFIQEEDLYGSISKYDAILEKVMANYPTTRLWKVYHAG